MIISASRRTDIPTFYARWFANRVQAGYCTVPNPINPHQVSQVSLRPEDVDVVVFWTRNPRPLFRYLAELDVRGYRYYFQYTLLANPRLLDPKSPPLAASLDTFRELADLIGPKRVIWRYDPIVFSTITGPDFHRKAYEQIARALRGRTRRCVVSIMDLYRKTSRRLAELTMHEVEYLPVDTRPGTWLEALMRDLVHVAHDNNMEIVSCAEPIDLAPYGIRPGKCVDDAFIRETFGLDVTRQKDPSQRTACGCIASKDIGMYDSCLFGCRYCYATSSFERARENYRSHHPDSPSLLGWHERKHW